MNAEHLHRLMASGITGTCRQIGIATGSSEKRVRQCINELAESGDVVADGTAPRLNNRAGGTKPLVWRATRARVLTEAA